MAAENINQKDFEKKVIKSDIPVLVDFWAPWCGPCLMMSPILDELSEDPDLKDKISITKLNTDEKENQMLAFLYQIRSIPNMKLFSKGKVVSDFIGARSKDQLKQELIKELSDK